MFTEMLGVNQFSFFLLFLPHFLFHKENHFIQLLYFLNLQRCSSLRVSVN